MLLDKLKIVKNDNGECIPDREVQYVQACRIAFFSWLPSLQVMEQTAFQEVIALAALA